MDFFFHPRAIAIVGATPNPAKGGYAILKNLANTFKGELYPVNPRYEEIDGLTCYPSIRAVPGTPDLAILFISADQVLESVGVCAEKGIPGVIIQSGGFSEIGGDGEHIQSQLSNIARIRGIRIWGPNCMGLVDGNKGFVFSFTDPQVLGGLLQPGPVSLVVQSGMLSAGFVVDLLSHEISGFNKVCSIGNKADVNECDLLDYLLEDDDTGVIGFYLESFIDLRRFIDIYRRHDEKKPVVILKGGKSETGRQAALSHTASLAGDYRILEDVLKQSGIFQARDFHQMVDLCRTLGMAMPSLSKSSPANVAILTFSGASGIVASDFLDDFGLQVADLDTSTKAKVRTLFPSWMPVANPVDVWPAMEQHSGKGLDVFALALEAVLDDPGVDACMIHTFAGFSRVKLDLDKTARLSRQSGKPVFIWILGEREQVLAFQLEARNLNIPVYHELYRAVECMAAVLNPPAGDLCEYEAECPPIRSSVAGITLPENSGALNEHASKIILKAAGLPTVEESRVETVEACRSLALQMGFPVVLKGLEMGRIHKSEAGLIKTNIRNESQLIDNYHELKGKMPQESSVLIQQQVDGRLELILGYLRDPQYGPCVMVGLGGIFAETLNDTAFSLTPLTPGKATALIMSLKNRHLLQGARGLSPAPLDTIARYLVALGEMGQAFPSIREIDINPLILSETGPVIVDAVIILDQP